jgi:site-specific DNA recombinase
VDNKRITTDNKMKRAVAYVRVSTNDQAINGFSIDAQTAKIRAYAELYDLELVDVVVDAGISAKSLNRPGLAQCLDKLVTGQADAVVIFKLDRLTRSLKDWQYLIDKFFTEKAGKALLSVTDQIDTRSASGRLCLNMLMSIAEWERDTVSERTKVTMQHKKSMGEVVGAPGYGYRVEGKYLVVDEAETKTAKFIDTLLESGMTLQQTADRLNKKGTLTKRGSIWTPTAIKRVKDRHSKEIHSK